MEKVKNEKSKSKSHIKINNKNIIMIKGIYFTNQFEYARNYPENEDAKNKSLLISLVIPGNSFPVIEHPFENKDNEAIYKDKNGNVVKSIEMYVRNRLISVNPFGYYAKGLRMGYQSHFTIGIFIFLTQKII